MGAKVKVLILNGDTVIQEIRVHPEREREKFLFLLIENEDGKQVFHLDTTDGKLWAARPDLKNLGKNHQKIVKEALNN